MEALRLGFNLSLNLAFVLRGMFFPCFSVAFLLVECFCSVLFLFQDCEHNLWRSRKLKYQSIQILCSHHGGLDRVIPGNKQSKNNKCSTRFGSCDVWHVSAGCHLETGWWHDSFSYMSFVLLKLLRVRRTTPGRSRNPLIPFKQLGANQSSQQSSCVLFPKWEK